LLLPEQFLGPTYTSNRVVSSQRVAYASTRPFHGQESGINAADLKKLKDAGFNTSQSVAFAMRKARCLRWISRGRGWV
jgi:hypothetical protein